FGPGDTVAAGWTGDAPAPAAGGWVDSKLLLSAPPSPLIEGPLLNKSKTPELTSVPAMSNTTPARARIRRIPIRDFGLRGMESVLEPNSASLARESAGAPARTI